MRERSSDCNLLLPSMKYLKEILANPSKHMLVIEGFCVLATNLGKSEMAQEFQLC